MKAIFSIIIAIGFRCYAQTPISVFDCTIIDPTVTQQEIDAQDDYYKQCILFKATENYSFGNDDTKEVTALKEIHIEEDFHAGSFSSTGSMHLKLEDQGSLDVFLMNHTNLSAIPQFDKLELGLDFPLDLDQRVANFFNDAPNNSISPFDIGDLDIQAEFFFYQNGQWLGPMKTAGFYFEEFLDLNTHWENQNTPYNYRIRFTPRNVGKWKCKIRVLVEGVEAYTANDFLFQVVPSNLKDYTRIGDNGRYFKIGNEPFFPVGQNLPWVGRTGYEYGTSTVGIDEYHLYHEDMEDLSQAGANYFRILMCPWSNEIEYEKLGHYEDRMNHAWEIDRILDKAKEYDLRIHFNLQVHYPFEQVNPFTILYWDWSAHNAGAYAQGCQYGDDLGYCYSTELGLATPKEFMTTGLAFYYYKMRLRYIISRWGYSTQISVLELLSVSK